MRKRLLPIFFSVLLFLTIVLPVSATESGNVTVVFQYNNQPIEQVSFQIYKVAEWNGSEYSLSSPFSGYSISMSGNPNSEEWKTLATTLAAYAARDEIAPLVTGETDEKGRVNFNGISDGLYLVIGTYIAIENLMITPQPMLVSVPYVKTDEAVDYDVVTEPKCDIRELTEPTIKRRVLKIWNDNGNKQTRPQQVTVQLLCDGKIYDEQILNESGGWDYTWENLDAMHDWQLVEKEVPNNYTVHVARQGITFTVTNTNNSIPPATNVPSDEQKLPQTGLLWWPVPVLMVIGAILLFSGIFLILRKKDESNE